ncbi:MAG: hypothetical protein GX601_20370 [Anaerolineales bacterium]|nr:hypothetical protein [Anaerolineales bacterium]
MQLEIYDALLVALAAASTQLAKELRFPRRYLPLVSLASGILIAVLFWLADAYPMARQFIHALVAGAVAGFTASGLYDSVVAPSKPNHYPIAPQAPTATKRTRQSRA